MSRRLCGRRGVQRVLLLVPSARNSSVYGPGTFSSRHPHGGGRLFKRERRLLRRDDFFLCMYPLWRPSYHLTQSSHYDQVLTGVLPYSGSSVGEMTTEIRAGKRPSRPNDPDQNRRSQRFVWEIITIGWSHEAYKRCEVSDLHHVFSMSTQRERDQGD